LDGGGDVSTGSGTLTLRGSVIAAQTGPGGSEISGKLALGTASRTFTVGNAGALTISAVVSGAAGVNLTKDGPGGMILSSPNTYLGTTIINAGDVMVKDASALGDPGHFTSGGTSTVPESFIVGGTVVHAAGSLSMFGGL